ncbi:MAG: hypothetical protein JSR72_15325 [Proteobacteria bacterium]|nr:hypothetical protein [Pseudomonadota bacterium]
MSDTIYDFHKFVEVLKEAKLGKAGEAASFVWWAEHRDNKRGLLMSEICDYFDKARLAQPNKSRLEGDLRKARFVTRDKVLRYHLTRDGLKEGVKLFHLFIRDQTNEEIISAIPVNKIPYISDADIADARRMAALYVSLFCLENSIRRHIQSTLEVSLGPDWWNVAASNSMKRKEEDRRKNENENRWIPSRSDSGPLYALDWSDLVTLMRKYETLFRETIPDVNFSHRFSDLGNLRNVVAHNGVISDAIQFSRVELAAHDWIKQLAEAAPGRT